MQTEERESSTERGKNGFGVCDPQVMFYEITGAGAEELDGFRPTRYELQVLLRYWCLRNTAAYLEYMAAIEFEKQPELHVARHAKIRIAAITKLLSSQEVAGIQNEVEELVLLETKSWKKDQALQSTGLGEPPAD